MFYSVLLVEDDLAVLQTLKSVFESRSFDVFTARSASDAISALAQRSFDLVVTDMRMETDTAGYDVVHSAKVQPCKPVVAILSAFPIPTSECRDAGADVMFMKGGSILRMLDDLDRLLRARTDAAKAATPRDETKIKRIG